MSFVPSLTCVAVEGREWKWGRTESWLCDSHASRFSLRSFLDYRHAQCQVRIDPGDVKMKETEIDLNRNRTHCYDYEGQQPSHRNKGRVSWGRGRQGFIRDGSQVRIKDFCCFSENGWPDGWLGPSQNGSFLLGWDSLSWGAGVHLRRQGESFV